MAKNDVISQNYSFRCQPNISSVNKPPPSFKNFAAETPEAPKSSPSKSIVSMSLMCSSRLPSSKKFAPPQVKESKNIREAVRALPTRILTVGKSRLPGVQLLVDEYIEKLKCYSSIEVVQIRSNPKKAQDTTAQVREEDNAVMSTIGSNDWVVLLDEHGNELRSEEMAELIAWAGNTGASRLSFCIGGPYGHGPQLQKRADVSIRAWTILKGQKYHH